MRKNIMLGVVIISSIFSLSAGAVEYLSTDIIKGSSWRYQTIEGNGYLGVQTTSIIDYAIDSVWGTVADTLFFLVSERDSVIKRSQINTEPVIDTQYVKKSQISCKKADRITICASTIISSMFSDMAIANFDSLSPTVNKFCHPIGIILNSVRYDGLQAGHYYSGVGTHFGSTVDTTLFANKIGFLRKISLHSGGYPYEGGDGLIVLLQYNGTDVSYLTNVRPVFTRKSTVGMAPAMFKCGLGRNNLNPGFNLLGQRRIAVNNGFGMRIWRESAKRWFSLQ